MKCALWTVIFAALNCTQAIAIPGQTATQFEAGANSTRAFAHLTRYHVSQPDPDCADYEYMGTFNVGHDTEFHAKPYFGGAIKIEALVFDLAASPTPDQHVEEQHTVPATTLRLYVHISVDNQKRAVAKLDNVLPIAVAQ